MKDFEYHPQAIVEWVAASHYYKKQNPRTLARFETEFEQTLAWIAQFPETWPLVSDITRKCQIKHFPYTVFFQIKLDSLVIIAITHQKRHPDSWRTR